MKRLAQERDQLSKEGCEEWSKTDEMIKNWGIIEIRDIKIKILICASNICYSVIFRTA